MNLPTLRRYPGTRSFEDTPEDRRLFTGRDAEIREVCQRIASHRVIVLYAPSGTGKSSLLRAGVFPELRALGYLPLEVRFSTDESKPLLRQLAGEVERECARESQQADVVDAPTAPESFLQYFLETEFWGADGPMAPVLVLDQFEEIFYLHTAPRRHELFRELAHLIRGDSESPPAAGSAATAAERLRLVISLREEVIGQLAALGSSIPGLMEHAYRLPPLRDETAKLAITIPAGRELDDRYTPPFACDPDAVTSLIAWLAERSGVAAYEDLSGKVSLSVESFVLQVFCEHIEDAVIRQRSAGAAEAGFTGAMLHRPEAKEAVLRRFYYKKLLQFLNTRRGGEPVEEPLPERVVELFSESGENESGRRQRRGLVKTALQMGEFGRFSGLLWFTRRGRAVLGLLECDLLTSDGRRQPRDRREISRSRRLSDADIAQLERLRLVRTEPHGGTSLLNLTHDQLAAAIHRYSIRRSARKVFTTYAALAALVLVIFASRWWIQQERDAKERAEHAAAQAKQNESAQRILAEEQKQRAELEEQQNQRLEAAAKELQKKRREASRLAREQATHANTLQEAVASLAIAVKADPTDDEAFVRLMGRLLRMGTVLPDKFWQVPAKARARVVAADPDGRHFALLSEVPADQIEVVDAARPWERGAILPLYSDLKHARFALGRNGQLLAAFVPPRRYPNEPAQEQYFKQSGPRNTAGSAGPSTLWIMQAGEAKGERKSIDGLPPEVVAMQFSPRGKWLALSEKSDSIHLVNLDSGERLVPPAARGEPRRSVGSGFFAFAFHPADSTLAVISVSKNCLLHDAATGDLVPAEAGISTGAAFSPDGFWLACSGMGGAKVKRLDDWSSNLKTRLTEKTWTELAPPPHPHTARAFTRTATFSADSSVMLVPQTSAFPGAYNPDGSAAQYYLVTDWQLFSRPFAPESPSTPVQTAANPPRRPLRYSVPDPIRAYVDQLAVQNSATGQLDNTGRWLLEVVSATGSSTLRDLTQALGTDQFPLARADSMKTLAAGGESVTAGPARTRWTTFLTPEGAEGLPPVIRRVTSDGEFSEWAPRPVKRLRPHWLSCGGPDRMASLLPEGDNALILHLESDGIRVRSLPLRSGVPAEKSVKLPAEWQPVSLSAERWLIAVLSAEEGERDLEQVGVWDMETGGRTALFAAPEGFGIPADEDDLRGGISADGSSLACTFENEDSLELAVHTISLQSGATPPPWQSAGRGYFHAAQEWLFQRENPEEDTGGIVVRPLFGPGAPISLLKADEVSGLVAFEFHDKGRRLSVILDAGKNLAVHTFQRHGASWEREGTRTLEGCDQFELAALSDDGQWLAVLDRAEIVAWRLEAGRAVMLPRLPWSHASSGGVAEDPRISSLRFVPGSSVLALQFASGRIALSDLAPWSFDTRSEERVAFAELASFLAAPDTLFAAMRASAAPQANAPQQVAGFLSPAEFLWNRYPREDKPLAKVVAWLLDREGFTGPHPFSAPGESLETWRLACRDTGGIAALRDALELNPADPEALALYGAALTNSPRAAIDYGAIMAAFHYAQRNANAAAADRIRSLETEAMRKLAAVMLEEKEPARADAALKAAGVTDAALQDRIRQAREEAERGLPTPEAGAMAE
jgi:hypothetical protein